MYMNETIWEEKLDIASLVTLGAINRAPTRLLARICSRAAARRGPIHRAQGTSRSDVPVCPCLPRFICSYALAVPTTQNVGKSMFAA